MIGTNATWLELNTLGTSSEGMAMVEPQSSHHESEHSGAHVSAAGDAQALRGLASRLSLIFGVLIAALLVAARLDIGMEGAWLHPTPRINSLSLGLGFVPLLTLSVAALLWIPMRLEGGVARAARVLATLALVAIGVGCASLAFFLAFFVG